MAPLVNNSSLSSQESKSHSNTSAPFSKAPVRFLPLLLSHRGKDALFPPTPALAFSGRTLLTSVISPLFSHPSTSYVNFRFFLITLNHAITSPIFGRSSTLVPCLSSAPSCIPFTFTAKIITCLNTVPQFSLSSPPPKQWLDADVLKLLLVSSQITLKTLHPMSKCKAASYAASTPVTVTSWVSRGCSPSWVSSVNTASLFPNFFVFLFEVGVAFCLSPILATFVLFCTSAGSIPCLWFRCLNIATHPLPSWYSASLHILVQWIMTELSLPASFPKLVIL